jgi:septal ring factor EnvC (AmiA/AmiB activator)
MMTEIEQILIGLVAVGAGLTLKVVRDGLREIEKFQGVIAYTQEETARYEQEREQYESEAGEVQEQVSALKQEVTSLEQRSTTMRTVVARKRAAIEKEKEKESEKNRSGL